MMKEKRQTKENIENCQLVNSIRESSSISQIVRQLPEYEDLYITWRPEEYDY